MSTHRLTVTYNGISDSYTPLNLTYIFIQNGTMPTTTPVPSSTSRARNIGAVVGGAVGLVAILLTIFFLYRRRRNSKRSEQESYKESTPYVENPTLHYDHPREGRPIATVLDPGTNPAINPGSLPTDRGVVGPPPEVLIYQDVDMPEGSVIDLPPAYSLQ